MPKPWAPYEVGFIDHPKFRALSGNAICLWIEGKNYCDDKLTDGLLPTHIVKQFRFWSKKNVTDLSMSCGPKNETDTYAPLWETHPVGWKMHDYLEHNDGRDAVMARKGRVEDLKEKERQRKAEWRARKAAKMSGGTSDVTQAGQDGTVTPLSRSTPTPQPPPEPSTPTSVGVPLARATIIGRRRLDAAWEGPRGLYVLQSQHQRFVASRNGNEAELFEFYQQVGEVWGYGEHKDANIEPDMFRFWTARYAERWPPSQQARVLPEKGIPAWAR